MERRQESTVQWVHQSSAITASNHGQHHVDIVYLLWSGYKVMSTSPGPMFKHLVLRWRCSLGDCRLFIGCSLSGGIGPWVGLACFLSYLLPDLLRCEQAASHSCSHVWQLPLQPYLPYQEGMDPKLGAKINLPFLELFLVKYLVIAIKR